MTMHLQTHPQSHTKPTLKPIFCDNREQKQTCLTMPSEQRASLPQRTGRKIECKNERQHNERQERSAYSKRYSLLPRKCEFQRFSI